MPCYCGSDLEYEDCCQRHVEQRVAAPTAEALMRSRYSAYVLGKIEYLYTTTHPAFRRTDLKSGYQATCDSTEWIGLKVLNTFQGLEKDKVGKVEFEATYLQEGRRAIHREKSRFKRHSGKWYYTDGEVSDMACESAGPG